MKKAIELIDKSIGQTEQAMEWCDLLVNEVKRLETENKFLKQQLEECRK